MKHICLHPCRARNLIRCLYAVAGQAAPEARQHSTVKRRVAIHIGYIGTDYRGSQFLRQPGFEAVEDVLEAAIAASGGILPSNVGHTHRTKWSRSSRTDKGVHSLSTVIGLNMEVHDQDFIRDQEGQGLAQEVNKHLPPQIRIFSVQRVNKSFDARHSCDHRTYDYHLPARVLGLEGNKEDEQILTRLSACLNKFLGRHPFHNYTVRKHYRPQAMQKAKAVKQQRWETKSERLQEEADPNPSFPYPKRSVEAEGGAPEGQGVTESPLHDRPIDQEIEEGADSPRVGAASAEDAGGRDQQRAAGSNEGASDGSSVLRPYEYAWVKGEVGHDKIGQAHFRNILQFEASQLGAAVPGGQPYVTVTIKGASFMVYQIRHMLAVAVSVATGRLPMDFVDASLNLHARVRLPVAPSSTLVLSGCDFQPFPVQNPHGQHPLAALSGDRLDLRNNGRSQRMQFQNEVLNPALNSLLGDEQWDVWLESLDAAKLETGQVEGLIAKHKEHIRS